MATETLDTKGLNCPIPVLRTKKALKSLNVGDTLEILATDPGAVIVPRMLVGFTDAHYFRDLGIHAYGFVPRWHRAGEARGIHGPDERVSVENLERGVQTLIAIITELDRHLAIVNCMASSSKVHIPPPHASTASFTPAPAPNTASSSASTVRIMHTTQESGIQRCVTRERRSPRLPTTPTSDAVEFDTNILPKSSPAQAPVSVISVSDFW